MTTLSKALLFPFLLPGALVLAVLCAHQANEPCLIYPASRLARMKSLALILLFAWIVPVAALAVAGVMVWRMR